MAKDAPRPEADAAARAPQPVPDPATSQPGLGRGLPLPHERDESVDDEAPVPLDPTVVQAKKDLDAGLIDTDLRNAPGADAEQRKKLLDDEVPGPGSGADAAASGSR